MDRVDSGETWRLDCKTYQPHTSSLDFLFILYTGLHFALQSFLLLLHSTVMHFVASLILASSLGSLARAASLLSVLGGTGTSGPSQQSGCTPFSSTFSSSDVSSDFYTPFIAISPEGSYEATGDGLVLHLTKPDGTITTEGHVNSALGQGATVNSTFLLS